MHTPWGRSDSQITLKEGVISVSTASHGGLLIAREFAEKNLSEAARKYGLHCGQTYLAYEEDLDWAIPAFELPDLWPKLFEHADEYIKSDPYDYLHKKLSFWRADYLLERGIEPDPEGYDRYLANKKEDEMRDQEHPDLIVAARGDWHTKISGVVEVTTADGKEHLVTEESYDRLERPRFLSKCIQYSAN